MKRLAAFLLILLPALASAQSSTDSAWHWQKPNGYFTFSPAVSILLNDFSKNIHKKVLAGFNFDISLIPSKKINFWDAGLQMEFFYPGSRTDEWDGIELKTKSSFGKIMLLNRIRPFKSTLHRVEPFLEFTYGLNISSTKTDYKIVDEATFLEKFLFDEEDEVETVNVQKFSDTSYSLGLGGGIMVKKTFIFLLRYNFSPETGFVRRSDVTVNRDGKVHYSPSSSKMETLTFSIGISFEKIIHDARIAAASMEEF